MIYVLDTNVLGEKIQPAPDAKVVDFLRRVPAENIRLSAVVLSEIAQGVENNPTPALQEFLRETRNLPVVEFGEEEAMEWGRMTSAGLRQGLELCVRDTQIAATAAVRGWTVATRNTSDFKSLGVLLFNPWTDTL